MRYLIAFILLLIVSVWVGIIISHGSGYVLIAYQNWSLETSLWVAITCLVLTFFILYVLFRIIGGATQLSSKIKKSRNMKKYRRGRKVTTQALCELLSGLWPQAESNLLKSAKMVKNPVINYLAAAKAANAQHNYNKRDDYLEIALTKTQKGKGAVEITRARLQIESQQWERALATLSQLQQRKPKLNYITKLLLDVHLKFNDWQAIFQLLPEIRKNKLLEEDVLNNLEKTTTKNLLKSHLKNPQKFIQLWNKLPKTLQSQHEIHLLYVENLFLNENSQDCLNAIKSFLKKEWNADLVLKYAQIESENTTKQLSQLEDWIKKYPKKPELLLATAQLSYKERYYAKAINYLEQSLKIKSLKDSFHQLALCWEAQNDLKKTIYYLKKSLECEQ